MENILFFNNQKDLDNYLSSNKLSKKFRSTTKYSFICPDCYTEWEKTLLAYQVTPVFKCKACATKDKTKDFYASKHEETLNRLSKVIHINDINECSIYPSDQRVSYNCKGCGKLLECNNSSLKRNIKFLCKSCSIKLTIQTDEHRSKCRDIQLTKSAEEIELSKIKRAQTNLDRYGVENLMELESSKEKIRNTCLDRYGVDHFNKLEESRERLSKSAKETYEDRSVKAKKTCLERYGVEFSTQATQMKEKSKQTCLDRYGVTNGGASEISREKSLATLQDHYGKEYINVFQVPEIKDKIKDTCYRRYGVYHWSQTQEAIKCRKVRYDYNGIYFDSSWELAFYAYHAAHNIPILYHTESINYTVNNTVHTYYPDFVLDGQLVEIKGSHFLKNGSLIDPFSKDKDKQDLAYAKYLCMKNNNVKIISAKEIKPYLKYMEESFGDQWMTRFKKTN